MRRNSQCSANLCLHCSPRLIAKLTVMRKPDFAYAKTKSKTSCAVTVQMISALALFRYIHVDSTIPLLRKSEISSLWQFSVVVQPDLCQTWSKMLKRVCSPTDHMTLESVQITQPNQSMLYLQCVHVQRLWLLAKDSRTIRNFHCPHRSFHCFCHAMAQFLEDCHDFYDFNFLICHEWQRRNISHALRKSAFLLMRKR